MSAGVWIDLSEPLSPDVHYPGKLPRPSLEVMFGAQTGHPRVTRVVTTTHTGTHIDAPTHFFPDGASIDRIPLGVFHGWAAVKRVVAGELEEITAADIEGALPAVETGDMLFIATGWDRLRGTSAYSRHPCLAPDAADWIVSHGVSVLGIDFITPDRAFEARHADERLLVHEVLLGAGILIVEQLRLGEVSGERVEVFAFPIAIRDGDGAPARVVARRAGPAAR